MLFITIWLLILCASGYLFYRSGGSLSLLKPNLNSIIFYYSLLISSYIGSLFIVLGTDHYYMINKLTHQEYRTIGFIVISFVMLVFPLVMFLISKIVGFEPRKEFTDYLEKEIVIPFKERNDFFIIFLGMAIVSLLAIVYTMLKTPHVPIFELILRQTDMSPGELRIQAQRNFEGVVVIRNIFAIALTPLLSFIAYVYKVKTGESRWKILFWILFFGSLLITTYDLAKSPVFFYLIMFLLLRLYAGSLKFTWSKLVLWGTVGAIGIVSMYIIVQDVTDIKTYLSYNSGPIGRLIFAQISPTFLHLNIFGETLPYLMGKSLPSSLIGFFDVEQVRSARLVMAYVFPEKVEAGTAGVLNTLFVAEAFANFGYVGIVAGTIYISALVQTIYIIFIRLPKNPVFLSLFVYFTVNIPRTLVGGFSDFLFNPVWVMMISLFVGLLLFVRLRIDLTSLLIRKKSRRGEV